MPASDNRLTRIAMDRTFGKGHVLHPLVHVSMDICPMACVPSKRYTWPHQGRRYLCPIENVFDSTKNGRTSMPMNLAAQHA